MFDRPSFQSYYLSVDHLVADELKKSTPQYLVQIDPEEYLSHLVSELSWQELTWDESAMTMEPFVGRRKINDYWRMIEVEQPGVRLRVPFAPHPQRREFLDLLPSSLRMPGEPQWNFQGNTLVMETGADKTAIDRALDEVRFWIGGRNANVRAGNETLGRQVASIWKRKREELEKQFGDLRALTERVKIPLFQDQSAPKPIFVQPSKLGVERPVLRPGQPEPELDLRSVEGIVGFIEMYSRQLEVTPVVYSKLGEEELRDLVLSMLNVNYPTTGETFSKHGKTDLFLRPGGGGSLIVECKRWRGAKQYREALEQLFGYLTWRHGFGVLLTFCTNKDMTASVAAAKEVVRAHETTVGGSVAGTSSRFKSRHVHPQDRDKDVEVFHLFVDLSVGARV